MITVSNVRYLISLPGYSLVGNPTKSTENKQIPLVPAHTNVLNCSVDDLCLPCMMVSIPEQRERNAWGHRRESCSAVQHLNTKQGKRTYDHRQCPSPRRQCPIQSPHEGLRGSEDRFGAQDRLHSLARTLWLAGCYSHRYPVPFPFLHWGSIVEALGHRQAASRHQGNSAGLVS